MSTQYLNTDNANNKQYTLEDYLAKNPRLSAPNNEIFHLLSSGQYIVKISYSTNEFYESTMQDVYATLRADGWIKTVYEKDGSKWKVADTQPTQNVFGSPVASIEYISLLNVFEAELVLVEDDGGNVIT